MPFPVWILVVGLLTSLLNLVRDVTIYHVVCDGESSNFKRQIMLTPYYLVHLAFRSLALATFFIYWKASLANLVTYQTFPFCIQGACDPHNCAPGHLQHVADTGNLQTAHKLR